MPFIGADMVQILFVAIFVDILEVGLSLWWYCFFFIMQYWT